MALGFIFELIRCLLEILARFPLDRFEDLRKLKDVCLFIAVIIIVKIEAHNHKK